MHISNPQEAGQNKGLVIILAINVSQGYSGKILGVVIYLKICKIAFKKYADHNAVKVTSERGWNRKFINEDKGNSEELRLHWTVL